MDAKKIEAKEVVSASKKLGRKDAVALIKGANKVIVAKGRKVQSFPGGKVPWCINTGKSLIPLTLLFLAQKRNLLIPLELSGVMHQGSLVSMVRSRERLGGLLRFYHREAA